VYTGGREQKRIPVAGVERFHRAHIPLIPIEQEAAPAMIDEQVRRHALSAVSRTHLHHLPVRHTDHREEVEQQAVFLADGR